VTLCGASDWIPVWSAPSSRRNFYIRTSTLLVSQLEDGPARARRKVVSNRCPKPLPQTVSDPGIRLRGDLPKWRAPPSSIGVPTPPLLAVLTGCRNSRTARTLRRVSALWSAASSCRNRGSNRGFSRLGQSAEPTLLSLLWYKPGVRLPPRVANMVQTPGETLAGNPVDVPVSMG
jgi:hypothetical protein